MLLSPVASEKTYGLLDEDKYTFLVHPDANKTEIKIAVEKVFGVGSVASTPPIARASASEPAAATASARPPSVRSWRWPKVTASTCSEARSADR